MAKQLGGEQQNALSALLLSDNSSEAELVARNLAECGLDCAVAQVRTLEQFREQIQSLAAGDASSHVAMISGGLPEATVFDALATARSASARIGLLVLGGPHYHGRLSGGIPTWGARHVPDDAMGLLPEFVRRVLFEAEEVHSHCARARMPGYEPVREVSGRIWPLMSTLMPYVFIKDADLRFVWANEPFAADLHTTVERLIGLADTDIFPPEEAEMYQAEDRAALRADGPVHDRGRVKIPIRDRHGRPVALVSTIRSDSPTLVGALRIISRWASIVETTPDAMAYLSPGGVVRSWNPGAEMLYGYTRQEMEGRHLRRVARDAAEAELERLLVTARRGETIKDYEAVHMDSDGRARDVSLTMAPVIAVAGDVVGVAFTARDIADRKRTEERLQDALAQMASAHVELEELAGTARESDSVSQPHRAEVEKLAEQVRRDPRRAFDFAAEARACHVSPGYFRQLFSRYMGRPPHSYLLLWRMRRAARVLGEDTDRPVQQVAREFGYGSSAQFSRLFKTKIGLSPTDYRQTLRRTRRREP